MANDLKDVLKNLLNDASTLTVRTFRGGVTATFAGGKWTVVKDEKATLLAMTEVYLDGDVDEFIPEKDGVMNTELAEHHGQVVKNALAARTALIKGIATVVRGLV